MRVGDLAYVQKNLQLVAQVDAEAAQQRFPQRVLLDALTEGALVDGKVGQKC